MSRIISKKVSTLLVKDHVDSVEVREGTRLRQAGPQKQGLLVVPDVSRRQQVLDFLPLFKPVLCAVDLTDHVQLHVLCRQQVLLMQQSLDVTTVR